MNADPCGYTARLQGENYAIQAHMADGIKRYVHDGIPPGSFLQAIICNDLRGAIAQADELNLHNIPAYVDWFYNEAPAGCWGNEDKMEHWIDMHDQQRANMRNDRLIEADTP